MPAGFMVLQNINLRHPRGIISAAKYWITK